MKTTRCLLIALTFLHPVGGFAQSPSVSEGAVRKTSSQSQQEIQGYLDSLAADDKFSGAILVAKDGVPIATKAAGEANKAKKIPITLDTKFNLGSVNKMFTGVAIAQLAQAGRLGFNDPVSKYLPDYPNKSVADKLTIHQLLTHTSGLASYSIAAFKAQREKLTTIAAYFPLCEPTAFICGGRKI